MGMEIDQAWGDPKPACINHFTLLGRKIRAKRRNLSIFKKQITLPVKLNGRVKDPSTPNEDSRHRLDPLARSPSGDQIE